MILGSGRSPGEGNGNPLQFSCLEISTHGPKELDRTLERLTFSFWVPGLVSKITGQIVYSGSSQNCWAQPLPHNSEGDLVEYKQPQFGVITSYFLTNPFFSLNSQNIL